MITTAGSGETPEDPPESGTPLTPKRGAFPTPPSELAAARKYVAEPDPHPEGAAPTTPDDLDEVDDDENPT
ncbi:MAG: hypothetical protein ACR2LI_13605 [Propionibacteriaceae bacterium]